MFQDHEPTLFLEGAISAAKQKGEPPDVAFAIICGLNGYDPKFAPDRFRFAVQREYGRS